MRYGFGDYVLDTERAELQGAGGPIPLRRKAFQVLVYLLTHRERVVSTQELLEHLWPEQFVGDEVLKACIKAVRQALGERGRAPRFVRTLYGQGYRFVALVAVQEPLPADRTAPPAVSPPSVGHSVVPPVGRAAELLRLHALLASARRGRRQLVFVTGEAGLGKTTLVEAFVAALGTRGRSGSGAGSAWSITGLGRHTCRYWRHWAACAGARAGRNWSRSWDSTPRPGWCRCQAWCVPLTWRCCAVVVPGQRASGCCGSWPRRWTS